MRGQQWTIIDFVNSAKYQAFPVFPAFYVHQLRSGTLPDVDRLWRETDALSAIDREAAWNFIQGTGGGGAVMLRILVSEYSRQ